MGPLKLFKILLIFILTSNNAYTISLKSGWDFTLKKSLKISCGENEEFFCEQVCGKEGFCSIREKFCRNCAGDNLFLKDFFNQLGIKYHNSGEEVSPYEFIDFLLLGNFYSLSSRSIFNLNTTYNHPKIVKKFKQLCGEQSLDQIVFLKLEEHSRLSREVKYLACQSQVGLKFYYMSSRPEILLSPEFLTSDVY